MQCKKDPKLKYESEYGETNQSLKKLFQKEQKKEDKDTVILLRNEKYKCVISVFQVLV